MRKVVTHITLEPEMLEQIKKLAPEGNVSMWIRLLIKKELERIAGE